MHRPDFRLPSPHSHFRPPHWRGRRRFIMPFVFFFGGIILLFFIALGMVAYLVMTHGERPFGGRFLLPLCGIPVIFILISTIVSSLAFRRFGRPLSEVFAAIDSISEGDLSVRIPEHYPRDFGQFARRFNHMVGELERSEARRRNLTADIAHELRTPLHIIQGNLEGILDGVYQPTPEHINNTLDETKLLSRLVSDLQTLSLAESGQLPLHPTRFLPADLFNDIRSSFSSHVTSLGIALKSKISDSSKELTADYDRLNQVLSNLITNSLHHTPSGGTILLETESITNGVRIIVEDTGSGILPEDLPFIFDRFWRGDRSRTREAGSHSGLGLAIVKQLVQAHGGKIEVVSRPDVGTKFIIDLPQ